MTKRVPIPKAKFSGSVDYLSRFKEALDRNVHLELPECFEEIFYEDPLLRTLDRFPYLTAWWNA